MSDQLPPGIKKLIEGAKRRVSYQFSIVGKGEPGTVVTMKSDPLKADLFRALKMLIHDGKSMTCWKLLREIRFSNMRPDKVDLAVEGGIYIRRDTATFMVPCGITKDGVMEIDAEMPKSGKLMVAIVGWAEGAPKQ
jgi:hypothetical protein